MVEIDGRAKRKTGFSGRETGCCVGEVGRKNSSCWRAPCPEKKVNRESKLLIDQLNEHLIQLLDDKPQLLKSLQTLYELMTDDVATPWQMEDQSAKPAQLESPK